MGSRCRNRAGFSVLLLPRRNLMIISASRRTDIPAFYADWMLNRLRAGYCTVPNPFNRNQVSRISLAASDVDVIVFWTRNAGPLLRHLDEIDSLGYRYYFQFTILGYPHCIEPHTPALQTATSVFRKLAGRLGPERVVWRYDPIVFTQATPPEVHRQKFREIAEDLAGHTRRVVVSVVDPYRKTEARMAELQGHGAGLCECPSDEFAQLMTDLAGYARQHEMEIVSCAEEIELAQYGIRAGKCVDDELIQQAFGLQVSTRKDSSQRQACGCIRSRDIGMYDSCLFGCPYCYATKSFELARKQHDRHDPLSPSLVGWHESPVP